MQLPKFTLTLLAFLTLVFSQGLSSQELTYFTGAFSESFYQDDQKITRAEFKEILKKNEAAWKDYSRGSAYTTTGSVFGLGSGVLVGVALGRELNDIGSNAGYYIGGAGAFVVALIFTEIGQKKRREAVLGYNQDLQRKTTFRWAPAREGIGIAVHF